MEVDENEEDSHEIAIWEVNQDRLASMAKKLTDPPRLLSKIAGKSSCSIFRVPQSLVEINGKYYQPQIVSIGPYHHGQPHLQMIEEHKWRYLAAMLERTESKGLALEDYLKEIGTLESKARDCYSEALRFSKDEFVEMMVLDGCFIIEMFRRVADLVPSDPDDPIFTMAWIVPYFYRDFLRLENQIPFFVLQQLFDLSELTGEDDNEEEEEEESPPTLTYLALQFFNDGFLRPESDIYGLKNLSGNHLLDLVRSSFIPKTHQEPRKRTTSPTHIIHCVSNLRRSGIQLRRRKVGSFLAVKFRRGVIEMPQITIDDFMSSFLLNCVAFEQCHKSYSKHITTYATLLDCLINTHSDVEYLCDRNIIENYFGTNAEVANFINNLGKDVAFDIDRCYLLKLFNDVHDYYKNSWHVHWASFKHTYFETPWSFISAIAALVLLLLTLTQTYFTVLAYVRPA